MPTKPQHRALAAILESQRQLYNAALEERIDAYRKAKVTRTYFDQTKALTEWRQGDPEASALPANLQRATLKRLDEAYKAFFRRVKKGDKPGNAARNILHRAGVGPGLLNVAGCGMRAGGDLSRATASRQETP